MEKEAIVLAEYLDIDIENVVEDDTNLFENTLTGEMYYVFLDSNLLNYIREELTPDAIDEARTELSNLTFHAKYHRFFEVDDYSIEEDCMSNTEGFLNTEEREVFEYSGETYIIMKSKD